jgi:hypothetical protein
VLGGFSAGRASRPDGAVVCPLAGAVVCALGAVVWPPGCVVSVLGGSLPRVHDGCVLCVSGAWVVAGGWLWVAGA